MMLRHMLISLSFAIFLLWPLNARDIPTDAAGAALRGRPLAENWLTPQQIVQSDRERMWPKAKSTTTAGRIIRTTASTPKRKFSNNQAVPGAFFGAIRLPFGSGSDGNHPYTEPVPGDFNADGKLDVAAVVVQYSNGNYYTWIGSILSNGDGTFKPAVLSGISEWPTVIASGDVDRDSRDDIVAISGGNVIVLISNRDGSFSEGQTYPFAFQFWPDTAVLSDVNGDGKQDIVIEGMNQCCPLDVDSAYHLVTLVGNGDGTFQTPTTVPLGAASQYVRLVDVNGDGRLDVIGFHFLANTYTLQVLLSTPGGYKRALYPTADGLSVFGTITIGDVNNDGRPDIVAGGRAYTVDGNGYPATLITYLNQGDGTFAPGVRQWSGFTTSAVAIADMDNDGKADIVALNRNAGDVTVLRGNGDGTFSIPLKGYAIGGYDLWGRPIVSDFNGDGNQDVIVSDCMWNLVYLQSFGDGTYAGASNYYSEVSAALDAGETWGGSIALGDLNSDGRLDVVLGKSYAAADPGITVFIANKDGSFQPGISYGTDTDMQFVAVADVTGDGNLDVLGSSANSGVVRVFPGNGNGTLQSSTSISTEPTWKGIPMGIAVADFNKDGKNDIAAYNINYPGDIAVLLNADPSPSLTNYPLSAGGAHVTAGDLKGDGFTDLVVAETAGNAIAVLLNKRDGTGSFVTPITEIPVGLGKPYGIMIGDLNGDGKADLSFTLWQPDAKGMQYLGVMTGRGDGSFNTAVYYPATVENPYAVSGPWPTEIRVADLNSDGKADLIYTNSGFGTVAVLYGKAIDAQGNPIFSAPVEFASGAYITGLTVADLNGDGAIEYVAGGGYFPGISTSLKLPTDYDIAPDRSKASITAGQSASFLLTVTPKAGFNSKLAFSCGKLPTGASCSFEPGSLQPNGSAVTTALIFATTAPYLARTAAMNDGNLQLLLWTSLSSMSVIGIALAEAGTIRRRTTWILFAMMALLLISTLAACGGNGSQGERITNPNATPPGTYTVQVMSATGNSSKVVNLQITVQ